MANRTIYIKYQDVTSNLCFNTYLPFVINTDPSIFAQHLVFSVPFPRNIKKNIVIKHHCINQGGFIETSCMVPTFIDFK